MLANIIPLCQEIFDRVWLLLSWRCCCSVTKKMKTLDPLCKIWLICQIKNLYLEKKIQIIPLPNIWLMKRHPLWLSLSFLLKVIYILYFKFTFIMVMGTSHGNCSYRAFTSLDLWGIGTLTHQVAFRVRKNHPYMLFIPLN